jgi:hypothetical protein
VLLQEGEEMQRLGAQDVGDARAVLLNAGGIVV